MRKAIKPSLAIAFLAGVCCCPLGVVRNTGSWELAIHARSASGKPIAAVSAARYDRDREAQSVFEDLALPEAGFAVTQEPVAKKPLIVPVQYGWTTRHALLFDYQESSHQDTKLVVVVKYQDGRRAGRLLEVPDRHQARELTVIVP